MNNQHRLRLLVDQTRRMVRWLATLARREDGANMVIVAGLMTVLIGFAGLAIDGSNLYYQNQRMQIAADAAALGGARMLALPDPTEAKVDTEIQALGTANAADYVDWDYVNNQRGVQVTAMRTFEPYFARIFGYTVFTATAQAEAHFEPVTGVDNLYPLTLDCECFGEGYTGPIDDGGGGGGTPDEWTLPDDVNAPISGTVQLTDNVTSTYSISYEGRTDNTWTYRVDEVDGHDLSHWLLSIDTCLDQIVSYEPSGAEIGTDSSTGVPGIKWNVGSDFTSGYFSFTLNDTYPAGLVEAVAKGGNGFGTVSILGPICDGTNGGPSIDPDDPDATNYCVPTIDFETDAAGAALAAGQVIDNEWAAWGVQVTSNSSSSHPPMIFNTASPTGNDEDLGSPNEDFGGPGLGVGGRSGQPGQNSTPQGKVLIVAESNNSADPDDSAGGGSLIFTFAMPVRVDEVRILDIDDVNAAGTIKAYSDGAGTSLVATGKMLGLGDNAVQTVGVNARDVRRLDIQFPESGSVAALVSCRNQTIETYDLGNLVWSDINDNGLQDESEPGIAGVVVELYVAGKDSVVMQTTTNATGKYEFADLPPGNYEVKIAAENFDSGGPLEGAEYSTPDVAVGGDDTTDSDFDPSTGRASVNVVGSDIDTVDGGFVLPDEPGGDDAPISAVITFKHKKTTQIKVSFVGREGRTWTYYVEELGGHSLSHWNLLVPPCAEHVEAVPGGSFGLDGSTDTTGFKWNVGDGFTNGTFSFTLDDVYAFTEVDVLAKAANAYATMRIVGPDCTTPETNDEEPVEDPVDPGDGTVVTVPEGACPFKWISWNMDGDEDGWELGEVVPVAADVPPDWIDTVLTELESGGSTIRIPLTDFDNGYAICGFAEVEVVQHDEEEQAWIVATLLKTVLRAFTTDPTAPDFGARDVRFVQ